MENEGTKMIRTTTIFALLLSMSITTWADERTEKAIEARQGLLLVMAQYFGPIVGMAKGQIPFDAAVIESNAGKIATLAPMLPDVFAMDTSASGIETEAKAEIWANVGDFGAKAATTGERAEALAVAATQGKGATMKAIGALGGSCKSCHDNYRQKK
jgi:cytochrome c556